jgi:arogenate dehydrogenase (NADP+)
MRTPEVTVTDTTAAEALRTLLGGRPVGIVGLGLMGGSLGLDLQALGVEVHGLVRREAVAERALERGLASRAGTDPALLEPCGLVVLALPLDLLLQPSPSLLAALPAAALVLDLGSVKAPVLAALQPRLPRFVGCHPMAGTAEAGVEAGLAGLYAGRPWVITPSADASPDDLHLAETLARAVGAVPVCCDAVEHDQAVALVSHLPVLVSAALLLAAAEGGERAEGDLAGLTRQLASSGFADTTRVGGGNPALGALMAEGNRDSLLEALALYRQQLDGLTAAVTRQDWQALRQALEGSAAIRPDFL